MTWPDVHPPASQVMPDNPAPVGPVGHFAIRRQSKGRSKERFGSLESLRAGRRVPDAQGFGPHRRHGRTIGGQGQGTVAIIREFFREFDGAAKLPGRRIPQTQGTEVLGGEEPAIRGLSQEAGSSLQVAHFLAGGHVPDVDSLVIPKKQRFAIAAEQGSLAALLEAPLLGSLGGIPDPDALRGRQRQLAAIGRQGKQADFRQLPPGPDLATLHVKELDQQFWIPAQGGQFLAVTGESDPSPGQETLLGRPAVQGLARAFLPHFDPLFGSAKAQHLPIASDHESPLGPPLPPAKRAEASHCVRRKRFPESIDPRSRLSRHGLGLAATRSNEKSEQDAAGQANPAAMSQGHSWTSVAVGGWRSPDQVREDDTTAILRAPGTGNNEKAITLDETCTPRGGLTEQSFLDKATRIDDNSEVGLTKRLGAKGTSLRCLFPESDP